jgi:dethiobiotin synthetase
MSLPPRFYLTGTDTDVGKTVTAAALCAALDLDYWKPVQSGLQGPTDTEVVQALSGAHAWPERWRLPKPASPHTSAREIGVRLTPESLTLPAAPRLLVEGAGGWMVPYATDPVRWQADFVRPLGLPVVVVARSTLGTLNHTLLTLRALREDGLICLGLILVGPPHPDNARDLQALGQVPVLAHLPRVASLPADFPTLVDAVRHLV